MFSNAALHWMRDQQAVLAGVRRALKPGGRFVAEMGGHNNTAAIIVALSAVLARRGLDAHRLSPWYFPSAEAYRRKLEAALSRSRKSRSSRGRRPCRPGSKPWLDTFGEDFFGAAAEADRYASARRSRRSVAAGPDGRDRNLDCRLRPAALPRDTPSLSGRVYCRAARRSSSIAAALASATRFDEAVAVAGSPPATLATTVKSGA